MRPWVDIPLRTSFLSPGRGIHFCQITVVVCNGTVVIRTRGREGFTLLLTTCNMSRTSLWTSVNWLCSCLSRQPWSPATPQVHYCILMWFAARGAERPPGSYRDWIIYKVLQYCPGDLYNAQALFLYAVLCRFDVNTLWASSSFHKGSWKNMFQGHKHHLVGNLSGLKKKHPVFSIAEQRPHF